MDKPSPLPISRRRAVKWMLTASASIAFLRDQAFGADPTRVGTTQSHPAPPAPPSAAKPPGGTGYGTDPDLLKNYEPGELWPLTLNEQQRRTTVALCDIIIPQDEHSPSASSVGVHDFIDEWISAPYPAHQADRETILWGLTWLDEEAQRRFTKTFADLDAQQSAQICDDISYTGRATQKFVQAAQFFALFRNLVAGGFYTTPEGMKDLQYVGNVPLVDFPQPPEVALRKLGLV